METLEEVVRESVAALTGGTAAVHVAGDDYTQVNEYIGLLKETLEFSEIVEWNNGYGEVAFGTVKAIPSASGGKMPLLEFLDHYRTWPATDPKPQKLVVIRNARHVLDGEMNRENLARLQQSILQYKKLRGRAALVYCDEKRYIPDELTSIVYYAELKPPSVTELDDIAKTKCENDGLDEETRKKLSSMCVGMSKDSFLQILEKTRLQSPESFNTEVIEMAKKAKKNYVDKSGLLKYVGGDIKINEVGGLEYLKYWLDGKRKAFDHPEDARDKGIVPAKGILLAGMPGCGKSLSAKAIAHKFGLPLLQLDMGSLMGKYVGESEENMRRALTLAENSSPCILWVDEIEKAFAGLKGDESGVSQRLFGSLLTWLNDKTARVFVVATANDISVLPPEFLRRGRFDEIFYVDFPTKTERKDIFRIHLKKALEKFAIEKFDNNQSIDDLAAEMAEKTEMPDKPDAPDKSRLTKALKAFNTGLGLPTEHYSPEFMDKALKAFNTELGFNLETQPADKDKKGDEPADKAGGYAGSDIAALVSLSVEKAWNADNINLLPDILERELEDFKPLSKVLKKQIEENRAKFKENHLESASFSEKLVREFEAAIKGSEEQQLEVASNTKCPKHILRKLEEIGTPKVKSAIIDNPRCSRGIIERLQKDSDEDVRKKAIAKFGQIIDREQKEIELKQSAQNAGKRICKNCAHFTLGSGKPASCAKKNGLQNAQTCDEWKTKD